MSEERLRIAIQKKGRLYDKSIELLKQCGITVINGGKLMSSSPNFPLDVFFLRDDDIPKYVARGVADVGILGENEVKEQGENVTTEKQLGFSRCKLSLAINREEEYTGIEWFNNKSIATSYPTILRNYLDESGINAKVEEISGSVEIAPGIGLAEGIFDIVSTGSTLHANGLKEVEVVMKSEAVLISNPKLEGEKAQILQRLKMRIEALKAARKNKYILLNSPEEKLEEICEIIPGLESPTVVPLAQEGWISIHSVIEEDVFWEKIEALRLAGATGILVAPIEKIIE